MVCGWLNLALDGVAKCLWPRQRPRGAKRVCIYRIGNIGDTTCAIPAMYAIRRAYPDARLTLVTSPGKSGMIGARELLDGAEWIDEVVVYHAEDIAAPRGRIDLMRALSERKFDVWFELPVVAATFFTLLRNMLFARSAGARWGCGWRYDAVGLAARAQSEFIEFPDEADRLLAIVRAAGIESRGAEFPLALDASIARDVSRLLEQAGIGPRDVSGGMVAFAPGAKAQPNRWPAERFVEVGRHLAARGLRIVILGGGADSVLCGEIAAAIGRGAANLAGKTTVRESCEILQRCSGVVCNDSGVQHLAAAVGTPCVSLFSCRDFRGKWRPHGSAHIVLRKEVECHTCLLDVCPYDNRCIKLISTEEVCAAADRILSIASHAPTPSDPTAAVRQYA